MLSFSGLYRVFIFKGVGLAWKGLLFQLNASDPMHIPKKTQFTIK